MSGTAKTSLVHYEHDDSPIHQNGPYLNVDVAAGTALTNNAVETVMSSHTFAPGDLRSGDVIEFEWIGRVTAQNSTDTIQFIAYFGNVTLTTAIATTDGVDAAVADIMLMKGRIVIRDADDSGTYIASVITDTEPQATAAGALERHVTITASVDFTASVLLEISGNWSVASASNSAQPESFVVLQNQ